MPLWLRTENHEYERTFNSLFARYKRNGRNLFGAPLFEYPASNAVGPEVSSENHYIEALDVIDLPQAKSKHANTAQGGENSSNTSIDQSEQTPIFTEIDYIKEMANAMRKKYKNTKTGEFRCHMCKLGVEGKCLRQAAFKRWLESLETGNTKCMSDGFVKMVSFSNKKRRDGGKMFYGSPITKPIVLQVDSNSVILWDEFRNYFEYFMSTYYPETCTFSVEAKMPMSNIGIKNSKESCVFQESWARMEHDLNNTDEEPRTKCVKATIIVEIEEPEEATSRQLSFFHDIYVPIPDSVIMKKPDNKSTIFGFWKKPITETVASCVSMEPKKEDSVLFQLENESQPVQV